MMVFQQLVLAVNVVVTILFGVDCLIIDSPKVQPRTKAKVGELLTVLFFAFLVLLLLFAVVGAAMRRNPLYLALSAYAIVPFAIGGLVRYRTLRFYTVLQFLSFLLSAATLCAIH